MTNTLAIIISVVGMFLLSVIGIATYFSYSNKEIALYNQIEAKHLDLKNHADNTWKQIKQVASVSDNYKDAFIEAYSTFTEKRNYGGEQIKVIFEDNPQMSDELWINIQRVITKQRNVYAHEQSTFSDMVRNYKTFCAQFPASIFVSERPTAQFKIVTSTKTEEMFDSGKEDNIDVFN